MATLKVELKYSLAPLTTFKLGGAAAHYTCVKSEVALLQALEYAKTMGLPIFALGSGSNILFCDDGFDGLVIHNKINGLTRERSSRDGKALVHACSGEDWQGFVDWCVSRNLQGLECLAGIPGSVGACPVQNIGAYGQEVSDTIVEVRAFEIDSGKQVILRNEACRFGYRASIFNAVPDKYFITRVTFMLSKNANATVTYHDLVNQLEDTSQITIRQIRDSTVAVRAGKGLMVGKGHEGFRCAGSFFKNPVLPAQRLKDIEDGILKAGAPWHWPVSSKEVKISAARIIQSAGFEPGYRKGNVGLSPKHTLIVCAYDAATAQEVVEFAQGIQEKVNKKFGILLKPEVRLVGFPGPCLGGC